MANPTCTSTQVVDQAACYLQSAIQPSQQRALYLYARSLELKAIGGTDYTAALTTILLTDAQALTCKLNDDQIMAAKINLAFINAAAAGASVPATLAEKVAVINCLNDLVQQDDQLAKLVDLLLTCQLGIHKPYVQ